ncbi:hypothetical protein L7F22_005669 [Adiantum nelumboides]|nr:hypothetical protein [Adiantum nelumboides]
MTHKLNDDDGCRSTNLNSVDHILNIIHRRLVSQFPQPGNKQALSYPRHKYAFASTQVNKRRAKANVKEKEGTAVPEQHNVKKLKRMKEMGVRESIKRKLDIDEVKVKGYTGKGKLEKLSKVKIALKRDGMKKNAKKHVEKGQEDERPADKALALVGSSKRPKLQAKRAKQSGASSTTSTTVVNKRRAKANVKEKEGTAVPEQHNVKKLKRMKEMGVRESIKRKLDIDEVKVKGYTGKGKLEKLSKVKIALKRDGMKKNAKKHVEKGQEDERPADKALALVGSSKRPKLQAKRAKQSGASSTTSTTVVNKRRAKANVKEKEGTAVPEQHNVKKLKRMKEMGVRESIKRKLDIDEVKVKGYTGKGKLEKLSKVKIALKRDGMKKNAKKHVEKGQEDERPADKALALVGSSKRPKLQAKRAKQSGASSTTSTTVVNKRRGKANVKEKEGTAVPEQHNVKKLKRMKEMGVREGIKRKLDIDEVKVKGYTGKGKLEKLSKVKIALKRDGMKKNAKKHVEKRQEDERPTDKALALVGSSKRPKLQVKRAKQSGASSTTSTTVTPYVEVINGEGDKDKSSGGSSGGSDDDGDEDDESSQDGSGDDDFNDGSDGDANDDNGGSDISDGGVMTRLTVRMMGLMTRMTVMEVAKGTVRV